MRNALVAFFFLIPYILSAQSVGIGTQNPDKSAVLDIDSKSQGLLIPRLTNGERDAILNPARGLVIFCSTDSSFYLYNGSWRRLTPADEVWSIKGNNDTDPDQHFIGNIDNKPVKFKVDSLLRMQLDSMGRLQIYGVGNNLFIGENAGISNTTGTSNHFTGLKAGISNTTGSQNYFSGFSAGFLNTTGSYNHFTGIEAGLNNSTGDSNYFAGYFAGLHNTTGNANHFNGLQAGYSNTIGFSNYMSGYQAGALNTTGSRNYFSGYQAGVANTIGNRNYFSGHQAGISNTTGSTNHFEGFMAGNSNTGQSRNHFVGYEAGFSSTGVLNYFAGYRAGRSNTEGSANHFEGHLAGFSNTTANFNHFSGYLAGLVNTTGFDNYFSGSEAGTKNTTGSNNVFIGNVAGFSNTTGTNNHFSGYYAGLGNTKGNRNTIVGHRADVIGDSLNNAGAIGFMARVSQSNSFVIGGLDTNAVNVGIGTTAPQHLLDIQGADPSITIAMFRNIGGFGQIKITQGTTVTDLGAYPTGGYTGTNSAGDFKLRTGAVDRVFIQHSTGNVGIGTNTPTHRLQIAGDLAVNGIIQNEDFQSAALQGGWTNSGGTLATAAYYKDKEGRVHLRGTIQHNTPQATLVFTLPPGYRPSASGQLYFPILNNTAGIARLLIDTDGDVIMTNASSGFFTLDGISFRAD